MHRLPRAQRSSQRRRGAPRPAVRCPTTGRPGCRLLRAETDRAHLRLGERDSRNGRVDGAAQTENRVACDKAAVHTGGMGELRMPGQVTGGPDPWVRGLQPVHRQSPPVRLRSTSSTWAPKPAAVLAAARPAVPPRVGSARPKASPARTWLLIRAHCAPDLHVDVTGPQRRSKHVRALRPHQPPRRAMRVDAPCEAGQPNQR